MKRIRVVISTVIAATLLLSIAAPAFGYNNPNLRDLRLRRLDPIRCDRPITLEATAWKRGGGTLAGVEVHWDFVIKGHYVRYPGDQIVPQVSVTNNRGKAYAELYLQCTEGTRLVQAWHPDDAADRLSVECNRRKCRGTSTGGDVVPPTALDPKIGGGQVATVSAPADVVTAPAPSLPVSVIVTAVSGAVGAGLVLTHRGRLELRRPRQATAAP